MGVVAMGGAAQSRVNSVLFVYAYFSGRRRCPVTVVAAAVAAVADVAATVLLLFPIAPTATLCSAQLCLNDRSACRSAL